MAVTGFVSVPAPPRTSAKVNVPESAPARLKGSSASARMPTAPVWVTGARTARGWIPWRWRPGARNRRAGGRFGGPRGRPGWPIAAPVRRPAIPAGPRCRTVAGRGGDTAPDRPARRPRRRLQPTARRFQPAWTGPPPGLPAGSRSAGRGFPGSGSPRRGHSAGSASRPDRPMAPRLRPESRAPEQQRRTGTKPPRSEAKLPAKPHPWPESARTPPSRGSGLPAGQGRFPPSIRPGARPSRSATNRCPAAASAPPARCRCRPR